jgi:DNA-binding beta-propeller fold protein YncE
MRPFLAFALPLLTYADPYVATIEKISGTVGFYSETGQNEGRVKVGAFPHEAVLSQDRKHLYVSNNGVLWMTEDTMGTNSISVVDVASKKKLHDIDLGRFHRPHGLALVPKTGQLLATTERPYGLVLVDPATRKVIRDFDVKGKSPHMVMLAPGGDRAYVSNTDSASVAAIELATGAVQLIPTGERPQG